MQSNVYFKCFQIGTRIRIETPSWKALVLKIVIFLFISHISSKHVEEFINIHNIYLNAINSWRLKGIFLSGSVRLREPRGSVAFID